MTGIEFRPYVGALYGDGTQVLGSAFVCHAAQMLITCAHCLESNPRELAWQPLGKDGRIDLKNWVVPVRNHDADVAIIINSDPLITRDMVAELPRPPQQRGLEVNFEGLGEYIEDGYLVRFPDSGKGRLVGSAFRKAILQFKMESNNVTPGYSGSPVCHVSGIGDTVVGMISGRYNSADGWNRDTAWVVTANTIRAAINHAWDAFVYTQLRSHVVADPLARLSLEISSDQLKNILGGSSLL